jgi:hypothetical protein
LFSILTDLRYSARNSQAPSLSANLLLTIALGIGSNVGVRCFVLGLTNPGSPLASMDRVVSAGPLSYRDYQSLADVVSPGFFEALGMRLVVGRIFRDDPAPRGCRVGMINEEAADLYFDGKAVGAAVIDGVRTGS